ncbi:ester cyclase [Streptomyces sp. NPDC001984]|uniref:ester cyclase n=1 Tax=Streptomyces sp. NPDC002619 TaxID=3364655 RepID=UPI0036ACB118
MRAFAEKFRASFPDLAFSGTADLIAEGDDVVGQWIGGGTQTGDAFDDMPIGSLPAKSGKTMRFTGTTVLKVVTPSPAGPVRGPRKQRQGSAAHHPFRPAEQRPNPARQDVR